VKKIKRPSYVDIARLPFDEKIRALKRPEMRARILAESADPDPTIVLGRLAREFDHMFLLGDPPDYEQHPLDYRLVRYRKDAMHDAVIGRQGRHGWGCAWGRVCSAPA
jgi:hypothetical protein